jgi:two-component system chemotaxis response regulator CheB
MPPTFTTLLAGNITRQCGIECVEGTDGMQVHPGKAYVAPGGFHMTLLRSGVLSLNQDPQENYCRPAVDVMLRSMAQIAQPVLTVILTGMGQDGLRGCEAIVAAGGSIIAQDEATSVVWGMPGMVARAGLCAAVLPLASIGPKIRQVASRN